MRKWVLIDATGMDENKVYKRIVKFSNATCMSTDEAIGYLAEHP